VFGMCFSKWLAIKKDSAGIRVQNTGYHTDKGGFPGTVRAQ